MNFQRGFYVIVFMLLLGSCSDSSEPSKVEPLTLTGKIRFNRPIALPSDVKVVGGWGVGTWDAGGYVYLYGSGTIDTAAKTFSITFPSAPPSDAVNYGVLGIADIYLVQNPPSGKIYDFSTLKIYGGINNACVVYKPGVWNNNEDDPPGIKAFPNSLTPAVATPPFDMHGHDTLRATTKNNFELLIDTVKSSFDFPNWS
jgi:hypothetical protein